MNAVRLLPLLLATLLVAIPVFAGETPAPAFRAVKDYRLEMELNVTAPLPFLSRFGAVTVVVFPQGARADGMTVTAISRTGSPHVTVVNPMLRLFADVPVDELGNILLKQAGGKAQKELLPGLDSVTTKLIGEGAVKGIPARRYRLTLQENAWIDLWTTQLIPRNDHLHAMGLNVLGAISRGVAESVSDVPGTLLYVEINTPRLRKICLLNVRSLTRSSAGFEEELAVPSFLAKAPLVDKLWN